MKGARPIERDEIEKIRNAFTGQMKLRNQALFFLGVNTGFRISELLSLTLDDVLNDDGKIKDRLSVRRGNMKGKKSSRTVLLNEQAKKALKPWLRDLYARGYVHSDDYLFQSRDLKNSSIQRAQAWKILDQAFKAVGLRGKMGTHAMRKTFANNVYNYFKDLVAQGEPIDAFRATSKALGHTDIKSTDQYLSFLTEDVDNAIMKVGM
jgi:integrase